MLQEIVAFYKDHYWKNEPIEDICSHVCPCILLNQHSINRDENGKMYGFTSWAFLDQATEQKFIDKQYLDFNDWNTGDRTWVIDTIYIKPHNIMAYNKTFFTHLLGTGKMVQWLRLAEDGSVRNHFKVITKEHWL